jgi:hypothetical protein
LDGEAIRRSLDDPDRVNRPDTTRDDQAQVRARSQGLGESARERRIVHPNPKSPARDSWFVDLKDRGADLRTLADEGLVLLDSFGRAILAELAVARRSAELLLPPPCVFDGVRVDHLVGSAICLAVRLVVAGKLNASDRDPTDGR